MRVLLDNCVDRKFARLLVGHDVTHASHVGWEILENGKLIAAAEAEGFEVLITVDKNLEYQQNLTDRKISIVTLAPLFVYYKHIAPMAAQVLVVLENLPSGEFIRIKP